MTAAVQTPRSDRRRLLAWAAYDWANSAFATTVMAGFFPVFFRQYWNPAGTLDAAITWRLGLANSLASIIVALAAPLLGALADQVGGKKRLLGTFAFLGAAMTAALWLVGRGHWQLAVWLYALASIGFAGGNVFYDALLVGVAPPERRDTASALGYALGYLGGGLLFAVNVWMTLVPATFGLPDAAAAVRLSFVTVGLWWAIFTLPVLLWVPEPGAARRFTPAVLVAGWRQLATTFHHVRAHRPAWLFLLAYFLYIDGVDTVIRMAVNYGESLGLQSKDLIGALLLTQFIGFPAALVYGRLGLRWGPRRGILLAIAVYSGVTIWATFMRHGWEFYLLAGIIGLVQGGVQALSRSYYSQLIPAAQAGEFFGFYNMLGKYATILGPLLMGGLALVSGSSRLSILALLLLFLGGAAILLRVPEEPAHAR
jgi:UMF1 family MFS transporter